MHADEPATAGVLTSVGVSRSVLVRLDADREVAF
jgi:hypothetical protein